VEQMLKKRPADHYATRILSTEALREPFRTLLLEAVALGAEAHEENLRWLIDLPAKGMLNSQRRSKWIRQFWPVWEYTPHWLAALTDRRLLLIGVREHGEKAETISIPVEAVVYLEYGMILLFSWITVYWVKNDQVCEQTLYYNAVSDQIVLPFIDLLCHALVQGRDGTTPGEPGLAASRNTFAQRNDPHNGKFLEQMPVKFKNLIPHFGLRKGEQVCQALYRPAQKRRLLEKRMPGIAMLQTNTGLLLATENTALGERSYGMTFTFLPLHHIQSIQQDRDDRSGCLHIRMEALHTARDLEVLFPAEMEREVSEFAHNFMAMQSAEPCW
jgi:hypothetical protein